MKKLLSYLIIIFFSSLTFSFSEDISDFQIEGVSVDDSVHDFFTIETLKKAIKKIKTRGKKFNGNTDDPQYEEAMASGNLKEANISHSSFETYDNVKVVYFSDTTIIKSVTGSEYFEEDNCNAKQKEAVNDLSNILEGNYEVDRFEKRGEIGVHLNQVSFELDSGGSIIIKCYDNVDKAKNNIEWVSALMVTINSKGIKKTPEEDTTPSSGEKNKTKSKFIQIKPTQADIGDKIKF